MKSKLIFSAWNSLLCSTCFSQAKIFLDFSILLHPNPSVNLIGSTFKIYLESKLLLIPPLLSPWASHHPLTSDSCHRLLPFIRAPLRLFSTLLQTFQYLSISEFFLWNTSPTSSLSTPSILLMVPLLNSNHTSFLSVLQNVHTCFHFKISTLNSSLCLGYFLSYLTVFC